MAQIARTLRTPPMLATKCPFISISGSTPASYIATTATSECPFLTLAEKTSPNTKRPLCTATSPSRAVNAPHMNMPRQQTLGTLELDEEQANCLLHSMKEIQNTLEREIALEFEEKRPQRNNEPRNKGKLEQKINNNQKIVVTFSCS